MTLEVGILILALGRKSPWDRWNPGWLCSGVWQQDCWSWDEWYKQIHECRWANCLNSQSPWTPSRKCLWNLKFSFLVSCESPLQSRSDSVCEIWTYSRSSQGTRHAEFIAIGEMLETYPRSALRSTDLYVTVEPCVMCASALRQYQIRKVYFGCGNDRFGGTGSILSLHAEFVLAFP